MLLVEPHHLLLKIGATRIGGFEFLVLVLQSPHLRLDFLHLLHGNLLFEAQREEQEIDGECQDNDGPTEVADVTMNEQQAKQQRTRDKFKPTVADYRGEPW